MNEAVAEVAKAVATRSASGFSMRWAPNELRRLAGRASLGHERIGIDVQRRASATP